MYNIKEGDGVGSFVGLQGPDHVQLHIWRPDPQFRPFFLGLLNSAFSEYPVTSIEKSFNSRYGLPLTDRNDRNLLRRLHNGTFPRLINARLNAFKV
jgi:hypothetical protein